MNKGIKILAVVLIVTGFVFSYMKRDSLENFFVVIDKYRNSEQLDSVKREFLKSGKLILDTVRPESFLTEAGVFLETNDARQVEGLPSFASSSQLDEIAKLRMNDMFANDYFEHVSPSGRSASVEASVLGYEYVSIGENIALGDFSDDADLVDAWMNSPGHRANILNGKFTHLGVAVGRGVYEGRDTWIAVQIFSKPLSACPEVDMYLKQKIDSEITSLEYLKAELDRMFSEIRSMEDDRNRDNSLYRQKIDEYNELVRELNERSQILEDRVYEYNQGVRKFNACINS